MASDHSPIGGVDRADGASVQDRLGLRLRRCREEHGVTLAVLAASAHCSPSFLGAVESGTLHPSLPMLQRLSRALQVSMGSWLGDGTIDHL